MTPTQFDTLTRARRVDAKGRKTRAARLVLVEGVTKSEAARQVGVSRQAVGAAVREYERALVGAQALAQGIA